ncbi:MAG: LamG domain-containing protein, partial [Candidatus Solibacter usitatus]|nr:LamG domain-containing protein [Candidatus Solibacter usitatus]
QAGPFGGYNDVTIRFSPSDTSAQTGTWTLSGVGLTTTIALTGNSGGGTTGGGGGSACVAPATNLVSWWSGDGNANDLTGGNNGTALGGLTYTTGKVGQAFQINGSTSYVSIGNPTNLRPTSALTMNAWINPAVAPTGSNLMAIITKWGQTAGTTPDADSFGMWLQQNGTSLSVYAAVHLSGGTNEPRALGGNVPLNAWSHVAMTFDGSNVIAYVNGQLVNTFPAAGSIISSSRNVLIGREDSSLPRAFNGAIDEVQMLNRALTAAEIQAIYNAGANGVCKTGGSTGGGTTTGTILQVDDGREEYTFGTEQGGPIYFVNRLTPTRYPATLRAVQILFPTGELAAGSAVAVLSSQNAGSSGGPQLAGLVFVRSNGTVTSQGTFLEFAVAPMTIQSGDFVVGFSTVAPPNVFPGAVDSSSGSKQRSYVSSTGSTFTLLDSITGLVPGNLLIRAKID